MKLPNPDRCIVDIVKLRTYCLNPVHPRGRHKARVFAGALGISAGDADELQALLLSAARTCEATVASKDRYGERFLIDIPVVRADRRATVRSLWIVRNGEDFARLTFPLLVSVERTVNPGGPNPAEDEKTLAIKRMNGHIGREASCATCHIQGLRDFASPGQIRLFETDAEFNASTAGVPGGICPPENYQKLDKCPEDR